MAQSSMYILNTLSHHGCLFLVVVRPNLLDTKPDAHHAVVRDDPIPLRLPETVYCKYVSTKQTPEVQIPSQRLTQADDFLALR